jgi:signal transduction histidine kinase
MENSMTRRESTRWALGPLFGVSDLGLADVAVAGLLSFYAVHLVTGHNSKHLDGGWTAALAVLLMTLPVVFARRAPLITAATLVVGAGVNWLAIGSLIRCGATLPAVFYVAFTIGSRCERRQAIAGVGLLAVSIVCQGASDPNLGSPAVAVVMVPVAVIFLGLGRLVRGRDATIANLQVRTSELREQREQTAKLAVEADRAQIAGDLDTFLHDRIGEMADVAATGSENLELRPEEAQEAFVSIQGTGRQTLIHMREVVGDLRDDAPTEPQPVLAQLDRLLGEANLPGIALEITGDSRLLPPGLELSGYRIIEHLLLTLERDPAAPASVEIVFGVDSLELKVVGPSVRNSDARRALAAATERAAVHDGSLRSTNRDGRRETVVLLPLATASL